jgi:hypothetical protein
VLSQLACQLRSHVDVILRLSENLVKKIMK